MENQIMTIGFIGNGKSTNRYHAPFIRRLGDKIRIKMIYARHPEKRDWDRIEGVIYTDDLQKLLGDPEIQVIIVTTPMSSHYEYAKKVLQAGKNCVVEKPFTSTVKEAEELFALAKEKGLMLQGYQNRRFDSDFLTAKKIAESGVLGSLFEVEMHFDYYRPEVPEKVTEYSKDTSFLYSHACHTLDQVISWMGEPDRVYFDVRQLLGSGRMNDYFDLDLYYGVTKISVKSSYFRVKERPSFVLYGSRGMFVKQTKDRQEEHLKLFYMPEHGDFGEDRPEDYGVLTWYDGDGVFHEEKVVTEKGGYEKYYEALYETVINGAAPCVKPEETLLVMRYLEEGTKEM